MMTKIIIFILIVYGFALGILFYQEQNFGAAKSIFEPSPGGLVGFDFFYDTDTDNSGIGTTSPAFKFSIDGNVWINGLLTVGGILSTSTTNQPGLTIDCDSSTSKVVWDVTNQWFGCGVDVVGEAGGGAFAWTDTVFGVATSTGLEFQAGFISNSSSTIQGLTVFGVLNASSTSAFNGLAKFDNGLSVNNKIITNFEGSGLTVTAGVLTPDCATITGGAGLCDGVDATGAGGASVPNIVYSTSSVSTLSYYMASSTLGNNQTWYMRNGLISSASSTFTQNLQVDKLFASSSIKIGDDVVFSGWSTSTKISALDAVNKTVTAWCPQGKRAIGGGGIINSGANTDIHMENNGPTGTSSGWILSFNEGDAVAGNWQITVNAICAKVE